MIKVGIAGARGLANIMGFQDMEGVEVVALCDINETLLDRESKKWHIPHTYRGSPFRIRSSTIFHTASPFSAFRHSKIGSL